MKLAIAVALIGCRDHAPVTSERQAKPQVAGDAGWVWWTSGAGYVESREVGLDGARENAVPAFEQACTHVVVTP